MFKGDSDFFEIVKYIAIIILVLFSVFVLYNIANNGLQVGPKTYVDPTSGVTITDENTGSIEDSLMTVVGFDKMLEGMSTDSYSSALDTLELFIHTSYPDAEMLSCQPDSIKKDENIYKLKAKINTGAEFDIELEEKSNKQFGIVVIQGGVKLFDYDSTRFNVKEISESLTSRLPYTIKGDHPWGSDDIVVNKKNNNYEILIESGRDDKFKTEVIEKVNNWLRSINYDPADFKFKIIEYNDGGV